MAITTANESPVQRTVQQFCGHVDLAYLGIGGDAAYYRCRSCGAGVIQQRGRLWVLRGIGKLA